MPEFNGTYKGNLRFTTDDGTEYSVIYTELTPQQCRSLKKLHPGNQCPFEFVPNNHDGWNFINIVGGITAEQLVERPDVN